MGPTVTRPVQDPLAVTRLENRLYINCLQMPWKHVYIYFIGEDAAKNPSSKTNSNTTVLTLNPGHNDDKYKVISLKM